MSSKISSGWKESLEIVDVMEISALLRNVGGKSNAVDISGQILETSGMERDLTQKKYVSPRNRLAANCHFYTV